MNTTKRRLLVGSYPILYHGTGVSALRSMVKKGIVPGALAKKDNWTHTVTSNQRTVYLTDAYAHYFAFAAANVEKKESSAILEIDVALLDDHRFVPDEDFLEQATRGQMLSIMPQRLQVEGATMKARTIWFRENAHRFESELSLKGLGTIGYRGVIPWRAVSRVALIPYERAVELSFVFDPIIHIANYAYLSGVYRGFMKSIFDPETEKGDPEQRAAWDDVVQRMNINIGSMRKAFAMCDLDWRPVIVSGEEFAASLSSSLPKQGA